VFRILSGYSKARLPHFTWRYVIYAGAFMCLGGYVAGLLVDAGFILESRMKCFGAGAALPTVVSAMALRLR
jgi:hypothetical protein